MRTVYLAGPITGCDRSEANDWRTYVNAMLPKGIKGISPLRCEPLVGERYGLGTPDPKFGTARAIGSKNVMDVRYCDMTLVYLPQRQPGAEPSYGTVCEIAWAHMLAKPTILVTDDPYLRDHPVVNACAGWLLPTLDDAIEVIVGVLADYV